MTTTTACPRPDQRHTAYPWRRRAISQSLEKSEASGFCARTLRVSDRAFGKHSAQNVATRFRH